MSILKMSEEEKKRILEKHKDATNDHNIKKDDLKKGLQKPIKKKPSK
jgi:hypothetical protein